MAEQHFDFHKPDDERRKRARHDEAQVRWYTEHPDEVLETARGLVRYAEDIERRVAEGRNPCAPECSDAEALGIAAGLRRDAEAMAREVGRDLDEEEDEADQADDQQDDQAAEDDYLLWRQPEEGGRWQLVLAGTYKEVKEYLASRPPVWPGHPENYAHFWSSKGTNPNDLDPDAKGTDD
jgi:hypothetical protein